MLVRIAAFEFRYLLANPLLWITAAAVFLMPFASLALGFDIEEDLRVFKNSPYEVVSKYRIISCMFMFVTTVFVANIVLRDDETEFGPILRSTGISKFDYLFGRFVGAMAIVALCLMLVTPGIWLGTLAPWIDGATVGPNRLGDHLYSYFVIALPNVIVTGAIFFALATVTRSMMATYLGLLVFLALYFSLLSVLGSRPDLVHGLAIADPFSARAFDDATRYWTVPERNSLLPEFSGTLLYNRIVWLGISAIFLAIAYFGFDFAGKKSSRKLRKRMKLANSSGLPATTAQGARPTRLPVPEYGRRAALALLSVRTRFEIRQVVVSPAFILLMAWAMFTTLFVLITQRDPFGRPAHPLTITLIPELEEVFMILPMVLVITYAGELVWRERDRRMHEIIDAAPHPNWAYVVPKVAGIGIVLAAVFTVSALTAIAVQLSLGFTAVEPGTYLIWYILPMTWDALVVAALAVLVQVLSPHKYIGWGIMVLYLAANFTGHTPDHNLLDYGGVPPTPYSDMDGITSFWEGPWVFRLYWGAGAALLLVAAHLLWRRGTEIRLKPRWRLATRRLSGAPRVVALGALMTFTATGAYAFYNTNVLNRYDAPEAEDHYWAGYEKKYSRYANLPQPSVEHLEVAVALHPDERRATVEGRYVLRNLTDRPISDIHLRITDRDLALLRVSMEGGSLRVEDLQYGYRIFRLDRPMAPGESRVLTFATQLWHRAFPNGMPNVRITDNGTFLTSDELLPVVGVRTQPLVQDPAIRREYGLPEMGRAKLEDLTATARPADERSWTTSDITLSTAADQTPIAPGRRVSDTTANGRRTARFVADAPIRNAFAVQSARYAKRHRRFGDVDLEIYYHPSHAWNVDQMLDNLEASLAYFEKNFGPYQFGQARIVEFPSYNANFAQAFAGTIPSSESYLFTGDMTAPNHLDYVAAGIAHEISHQYWGHQMTPAVMEGSLVLIESLAQYSAVMVAKSIHGEEKMQRLLATQLHSYLSGRAVEQVKEVPLVRAETQTYLVYNKGALALYLLQKRMGEDAVNRALRSLLERHRFQNAPYPRSQDLVEALRAEASSAAHQSLITDLFERIALYDFKVLAPTNRKLPDGRWEVSIPIQARKFHVDAEGAENETRLAEQIEVGLFTAQPANPAFDRKHIVAMERMPIRSGRQVVKIIVDRKPTHAGVDPYNLYIDRTPSDNVAPIEK